MKTSILILIFVAVAAAAPKANKLQFRNLFKQPVGDVKAKPSPRIIGGQEAIPHSIPDQAFLEIYSESEGWYCGGSLISQNYVLTAGHCGDGGVRAVVTLGAHMPLQSEETQVILTSTEITVHPDYDSVEITSDIAVIKLPESVTLTDAIQPTTLPSRSDVDNTFEGSTARISGWGLTDGFGETISDVLNYVDVEVISNQECEETYGTLVDSIVCTSEKDGTGSCNGDSGGPLKVDNVQIGVVSFGLIFCLPAPSAFTRVTSFLDWIEANTDVQIR